MRALLAAAPLVLALGAAIAACAGVDETAVSTVQCGNFETFAPVSKVLEARCGTIDCHGSLARPLRIFSRTGLRLPYEDGGAFEDAGYGEYEEYYPGGQVDTIPLERLANYRSVCGLEPEIITRVVAGTAPPEELTLVRKQRLIEKHKGGKIFDPSDDGDACIVTWLTTGTPNAGACNAELAHD